MTYKEFEVVLDDLRTEQECSDYYGTFFPKSMLRQFEGLYNGEVEVLVNNGFYSDEDDWLDCLYKSAYRSFKEHCTIPQYHKEAQNGKGY